MAFLDEYAYPVPWDEDDYSMEQMRQEQAWIEERLEINKNLPDGKIVGAMLGWGRGDGTAWYIVTKARPLTLSWVPACDKWQVEDALIRGLRKADILERIQQDKKLGELFGKSKQKMRWD